MSKSFCVFPPIGFVPSDRPIDGWRLTVWNRCQRPQNRPFLGVFRVILLYDRGEIVLIVNYRFRYLKIPSKR